MFSFKIQITECFKQIIEIVDYNSVLGVYKFIAKEFKISSSDLKTSSTELTIYSNELKIILSLIRLDIYILISFKDLFI